MKVWYHIVLLSILPLSGCMTDERETSSSYVKRENNGALYEPENGILHGAGQDHESFKEYASTVGDQNYPIIYMTYVGLVSSVETVKTWGDNLIASLDELPDDVIPQIGVNLTSGKDNGTGEVEAFALGQYDAQIAAFVRAIKKLDRPSFIRIGYEFEGSWNGYEPEAYSSTFKKISQLLRDEETLAATVWCSAGGSGGFQPWANLESYYPGDEWVDWWGVDIFSLEELSDSRLVEFLELASNHKKPVMIGETTPRFIGTIDGEQSWKDWFAPFFQLMKNQPQIKAFCYINWDWLYWSETLGFGWQDWKDARIQVNDIVKDKYILELDDPMLIHSRDN